MLEEEYARACRVTLQITGERRLLDQSPVLQRSIAVRNPYVDPLSFLQVKLLARRRQKDGKTEPSDGDREKLLYATLLTISGIGAGMRNTGRFLYNGLPSRDLCRVHICFNPPPVFPWSPLCDFYLQGFR